MIENHLYQGLKLIFFFFGVPSDDLRQVCGHQVAKLWLLKISAFFTGINLDQNNNNNNKSLFTITVIKYNSHPASGSANRGGRVYKGILY